MFWGHGLKGNDKKLVAHLFTVCLVQFHQILAF